MALSSPGVQVSVIDESFYTPAEGGTVPMIFVASASNKTNGSGTGIAAGTLAANAGKPYLITSQRDLVETFGDPVFYTDSNNNPIHAGELNEYGLQAAYSLLGVSNRAYVVRADIDLSELEASASAPAAEPAADTYWFDTALTKFGIFEWNGSAASAGGQTFTNKVPTVITDSSKITGAMPKTSVGAMGDYAVVATGSLNGVFYKNTAGAWVEVGSENWVKSIPVTTGTIADLTSGDTLTIKIDGVAQTDLTFSTSFADEFNADFNASGIYVAARGSRYEFYSEGSTLEFVAGGTPATDIFVKLGLTGGIAYPAPVLTIAPHTSVPDYKITTDERKPSGSVWIKTTEPNLGAKWKLRRFNGNTSLWEDVAAPVYASGHAALYALDKAAGGLSLPVGTSYVKSNVGEYSNAVANFKIFKRTATGATTVTSSAITDSTFASAETLTFLISESVVGQEGLSTAVEISVDVTSAADDADIIAGEINAATGLTHVLAEVDTSNRIVFKHTAGGDIRITDTDSLFTTIGISTLTTNVFAAADDASEDFVFSLWSSSTVAGGGFAIPSATAPEDLTTDGALWYNSIVDEVDIMVNDGSNWVGYRNFNFGDGVGATNEDGPFVSASEPSATGLVTGDVWIDTSDIANYPTIYTYNGDTLSWNLVDKGDQTTEDGILFADARYNTSGQYSNLEGDISDLLTSDFVDFDAPDPALYPKGMKLFNLRRSGFNVKKFVRNYINLTDENIRYGDENMGGTGNNDAYYPHRWVTESGNQNDGSGSFGQIAQRKVVVQSLQAMLNSNDEIRDSDSRIFNLMATPGYSELIGEMITLNYDRGLSAFVLGDSPATLTPDATTLNEWGTNVNLAVEDNLEGLVSMDEYMAVFYPWGFTSDNFGNNVVVPPSHMMLRTIALSDQVSYPWFAPAGTRRGGITNASASGYIDDEGEFVSIALNEGQRDTLYGISVNPITFITGAGLVNYGQKTRARNASSLDRINVARLVIYLRSQLNKLAKPYIFEQNDTITRNEIKGATESLLLELVGQRALYDYLVVCDESNNTPSRIDRNELYLDIAIEPVKSVEFIYIPLRLKNTGEISGL